MSVQVATLRFGAETRPLATPGAPTDGVEHPVPRLDLTAFGPARVRVETRWEHSVRRIDHRFRVRLPEAKELGDGILAGRLRSGCWELGSVSSDARAVFVVTIDERERVHLPAGVRHQLGFDGAAVVSLAHDRSRILIWPAASLDALLEALQ